MAAAIEPDAGGVIIDLRVLPRAGRSAIAGMRAGSILVRLNAAPVDGAANRELVSLLSATLRVPKQAVTILSGERGKQKRVRIRGIDEREAAARLLPADGPTD